MTGHTRIFNDLSEIRRLSGDPFWMPIASSMTYQFKRTGTDLDHCTYCPRPAGERCPDQCGGNYEKLQSERAADHITVKE